MSRRILWISVVLVAVCLLAVLMPPRRATAIPAFSREHGLKCNDCHAPFPLLNEFGMEFKQRGFRLPAQGGKVPLGPQESSGFGDRHDAISQRPSG